MRSMRLVLWVAALAVMCFAACNYTSGECWPVGQGAGDVGAGNGVIVAAGVGGTGDGPRGQAQSALTEAQCNDPESPSKPPPDDGATELNQEICPKPDWGAECMVRCNEKGAMCLAAKKNKDNPSAGYGLLSMCCGCTGKRYCRYSYNNGDVCYDWLDVGQWRCVPGGG